MILIVGGTGRLGRRLVSSATGQVRVLTRTGFPGTENVGVAVGDLRDADAVGRAMAGVTTVISAAQAGFGATGGSTPLSVDLQGNEHLIAAAKAEGVRHFILLSIVDAAPDHPLELWRMKYHAEEALKASGLDWTIIRCPAFMQWCLEFIGAPLWTTGRAKVFGCGDNPINFVSADDVAALVTQVAGNPVPENRTLTITGPENLSFNQVIDLIRAVTGATGKVGHVPLPVMRVASKLLRPIKPGLAREIAAGVFLDTADRTAAQENGWRSTYPTVPRTTMAEAISGFPRPGK